MAIVEYVKITDLDITYTDVSHPTEDQVAKYILRANRLLTKYCGSRDDPDESIKNIGIELVDILIHNRKHKDGIPGYQYSRRFMLTYDMKETLNLDLINDYSTFTHDPTTTPP
jgi:hypothetical protein